MLALAACDGSAGGGNTSGTVAAGPTADGKDPAQAKLDAYTEGYNKLIGTFGLPETAENYTKADVPNQSPSDSVSVSSGWLEQALAKLKEARALPGGPADLDKSGDALIAALDKVVTRLKGLSVYYDSKAYREDKLARGKQEDAAMRAEFQAALAAAEGFDTILKRERDARTAVEIEQLKKDGNVLAYSTKVAVQRSENLIDLFAKPEDVKNPQLLAKGTAIVAEIEKLLAEQRTAYAAAKAAAKSPIEAPDSSYESAAGDLTDLIGEFRDLKQSGDVEDLNDMVEEYNDAVESLNNIRN
ncbi:DUF3829 domain-containing protein [Sphingosinicella sp. BN140058]|uniref:DUF3829 domain-containing protein n=1 Tax=Sphingosinicella sp. BN140058 TaxID=1892855 RepID=UPI001012F4B0|nr:DUF3829 domain-containing protein [Sphingosinicella sp. BN140058]QAY76067.1 DUF3829 domain-containing protein [Sphingosinicella sp. BN140058]